jgi:hypothetical protein
MGRTRGRVLRFAQDDRDGVAPAVGAEGVDVFVLGLAGGLKESLEHVGYGAGYAGLYFATDYGWYQAAQAVFRSLAER